MTVADQRYPDIVMWDDFAMSAVNGILSSMGYQEKKELLDQPIGSLIAHAAYNIADAMMAERTKRLQPK